jgi:hypothetical protein
MAQNFRRNYVKDIGTAAQDIPDGSDFSTFDCLISIRMANTTSNMVKVDDSVSPTKNIYIVKEAPIPAGSSLELIDGGSKIVVGADNRLWIKSDTANSVDAWVSRVQEISS